MKTSVRKIIFMIIILSMLLSALAPLAAFAQQDEGAGDVKLDDSIGQRTPPGRDKVKSIDQPNIKDYWRNQERLRLLESGMSAQADNLSLTADDRVLVILVEFAGTDTFTWSPGDEWDPLGRADPDEAVYDEDDNVIVGDCSNIITEETTFTYSGPLHNEIPRPVSAEDRSGDSIWTEDFSKDWFEGFMWGDGVVFDYVREDGSVFHEDFTGESVKNYFLDMSGGDYEIEGDVIGWVQVPHSTWYYDADQCPGARSGGGSRGAIPGAGSSRQLVRDSLDAVNAISDTIPDFDWANYDQNGDGLIDRLWIVHAGYGEEDGTVLLNRTDYGEAAVWSHSSSVSPPYEVAPGISAGPYIIMPENGGIGVFAHEYAHNLGADDLYAYGNGETSAGFWALQADDWTGYPIGFEPPAADPWHLDGWGWLDPYIITDPGQEYMVTVGQASEFPGGDDVYRGVKIMLPDGELPLAVPVWQGEYYWWGGKKDLANAMMTTVDPIAIPAEGASWTFDLVYDVEDEWDFLWFQASTDGENWDTLTNESTQCEHDPGWIGGLYGFPDDLCGAGLGGYYGYNENWPDPEMQTFDLSAYAGESVWLRYWFMTDWGTTYTGVFVDNVMVTSGDTVLFEDDAEVEGAWTYEMPWERTNGVQSFSHNYYLQWRNVSETGGYDSALGDDRWRFGPANTGLLVWYNNNFYTDNEIYSYLEDGNGFGPKGRMLVIDSHPMPYRNPDWAPSSLGKENTNNTTRGQIRDAPFSKLDSIDFLYTDPYRDDTEHLYEGRPAMPAFHDSMGYYPGVASEGDGRYWNTVNWDASAAVPATSMYSIKGDSSYPGRHIQYVNGGWLGFWNWPYAGTGNPGDDFAQYGWHVEIVDQTESEATLHIWNALYDYEGSVTTTGSADPLMYGDTVDVHVNATNIGSRVRSTVVVVLDREVEFVSAYGGAYPLTAGALSELAAARNLDLGLSAATATAEPGQVIAVAWDKDPLLVGEEVDFGFIAKVISYTGGVHHDAVFYDDAYPDVTITGNGIHDLRRWPAHGRVAADGRHLGQWWRYCSEL